MVDVEITRFLVEEPRTVRSTREAARVKLRLQHWSFSTTLINIIVHARSKKHDYNSGKLESACPLSVAFLKHLREKRYSRHSSPGLREGLYYFNIHQTRGTAQKLARDKNFPSIPARKATNQFHRVYQKPFPREGYSQNTHDNENASAAYA